MAKSDTPKLPPGVEVLPSGLVSKRLRLPDGSRPRISAESLKKLGEIERGRLQEIENGSHDMIKRAQITLDAWWHIWLPSLARLANPRKPATLRHYAWMYRKFIKPHLGGYKLIDLTPTAVDQWLRKLEDDGATASNRAKALTALSASLGMNGRGAEFDRRMPHGNPCRYSRVDVPKADAWRKISEAQFLRLLEATPDYYKPLLLLLWCMGLRFGEATALRRRDVDLLHKRLTIEVNTKQLEKDAEFDFERERWVGTPKGGRSRTLAHVPERALRVIEELMERSGGPDDPLVPAKLVRGQAKLTWEQAGEIRALGDYTPGIGRREGRIGEHTLAEIAERYGLHKATVVNLMTGKTWTKVDPKLSRHISYSSWRKYVWTPAVEKAGLGSLRPHDLRHSAASFLRDNGMEVRVLQEILGHASEAQTKAYTHVDIDSQAAAWKAAVGE